ncbi:hypothetical protein BCR44DRAFT_27193 [Catenaria anguillulae PL171]|uniref:Galactose oxidase n=1 Tax=Catenaria anguillulae PL171 TaxID=765915 RepID=A0A1Y2HPY2_9FUNG|nr:hypothetical protein BCR44DRAFT_27193 [Catenaria anguillulae PL171]
MTAPFVLLAAGLCLCLGIAGPATVTRASSTKDISTAHLAPLSSLLLFGGYNASSSSQYLTIAGILSLASTFSTDAPPITSLDPLPFPTSRLVPVITSRGGNGFDVHLSNGVMNGQLGNRTFTYTVTANGSSAPKVKLQSKVIEGNVQVPFAPAYVAAASTKMDAMDGGVNWAVGGRYYPEGPFVDKMWVFGRDGPPSAEQQTQPSPSPRADAALVPLNGTHLLLSGGYTTNTSTTHSDMWTYSIASKSWLKYPHSTTRPRSHHALVVFKHKWVVLIGREPPLVEVMEWTWGSKPKVAEVKGTGPQGLETTAAVVVGTQIVLVGGLTASEDKDDRLIRVLKIQEVKDGAGAEALAFEWYRTKFTNTFVFDLDCLTFLGHNQQVKHFHPTALRHSPQLTIAFP